MRWLSVPFVGHFARCGELVVWATLLSLLLTFVLGWTLLDDPCAAARRLRQVLPYAVVSVVAVSRNLGNLRCIAEATGGLFLEPDSVDVIGDAVLQAAGQERPEGCP